MLLRFSRTGEIKKREEISNFMKSRRLMKTPFQQSTTLKHKVYNDENIQKQCVTL